MLNIRSASVQAYQSGHITTTHITDHAPVDIRPATVQDLRELCGDLIAAHYAEVVGDAIPLSVDWDTLHTIENAGRFVGAIAEADGIAGYALGVVVRRIHTADVVMQGVGIYVAPKWRAAGTCSDLLRAMREAGMAKGATVETWHAPVGSTFDAVLRRAHRPLEVLYERRL